MTLAAVTPIASTFDSDWEKLVTFLNRYYYKPDIEGLRIVLCTYLSHFYLSSPPVWLSVIGLPGTGKTELAINPLTKLTKVVSESTLTVNSFLSGFGDDLGILSKLEPKPNGNGILVFPDLTTTLLSEDPFTRSKLMGQLRRVYDGHYDKNVGNKGKKLEWEGKVTCIAACTPDIEDHWATYRDMGERWLQIHWGAKPSLKDKWAMADKAKSHEGHEENIKKVLNKRIYELMKNAGDGAEGTPDSRELTALAILVEECRTTPKREFTGKGYEVTGRGNTQSVARTAKSLSVLCKASTALRRSNIIEEIDISLARRVALESIPSKRKLIMDVLIGIYPSPISKKELSSFCKLPKNSFDRVLEDMRYLDIVDIRTIGLNDKKAGQLDNLDEDDEGTDTPYEYKRLKPNAIIGLNPTIVEILQECKLL